MLIIPVKDGENIDRALKRFKRKFDRTGTMRQLRKRQQFTKPSVKRRAEIQKAQYIQTFKRSRRNLRFPFNVQYKNPLGIVVFGGFFYALSTFKKTVSLVVSQILSQTVNIYALFKLLSIIFPWRRKYSPCIR